MKFKIGDIVECNKGFSFDPCVGIVKKRGNNPALYKILILKCNNINAIRYTQTRTRQVPSLWWYGEQYLKPSTITKEEAKKLEQEIVEQKFLENL